MPAYHIFSAAATGADSQSRYFFRYWPVYEASQAATVSGVPAQKMCIRDRNTPYRFLETIKAHGLFVAHLIVVS